MSSLNKKLLVYSVIGIITTVVLCNNLALLPMQLWDESRQANNALEMMQSGNLLYPTYENQPDFWNTKPHLLIIIQAGFFKLLGPGLLAIRLPSAIAGIITILIWFHFFYSRNRKTESFVFVFIMLTCGGFNVYHITRTGDYDAMLLMFISLCLLTFYSVLFEEFTKNKIKLFYLFFGLAFLTKSMAALIWSPIFLVLYVIFRKQKGITLRQITTGIWMPFLMVFLYYGYREIATPGYISAVWDNEIAIRYFASNEGHESKWYYYFTEIYNNYFDGFWILTLLSFSLLFVKSSTTKKNMLFWGISALAFLLLLSISKTRIHWYMAPVIPCLAAIVAIGTGGIFQIKTAQYFKWILFSGVTVSILTFGVINWQKLQIENTSWGGFQPQVVFRNAEITGKFPYNGTFMLGSYNPLENYYGRIFKKKNIPFKTTFQFNFKPHDTIFLYRWDQRDSIKKYNYCREIHEPNHEIPVWVYAVDSSYRIKN